MKTTAIARHSELEQFSARFASESVELFHKKSAFIRKIRVIRVFACFVSESQKLFFTKIRLCLRESLLAVFFVRRILES